MNGYTHSDKTVPQQTGKETFNKSRPLIVDDEMDICYLLKGILRFINIEADHATSLREAKDILKKTDPPFIFLDNHLSDGLGIEYISTIKLEHPDSKIVMITAHDTASDRQKAYHEGVDYFIGKPFTRDTIIKTVEKIKGGHVE